VCDPRTLYECLFVKKQDFVRDNEADNCNCPHQCRQLVYEPTISQAPLSNAIASTLAKDDFSRSVEEIINDHCLVEVSVLNWMFP